MDYRLLLALAVSIDGATTIVALWLGAGCEVGPLASRLIPLLGPLYFALEYLVLYTVAEVFSRVARRLGAEIALPRLAVVAAPLAAGINNAVQLAIALGRGCTVPGFC